MAFFCLRVWQHSDRMSRRCVSRLMPSYVLPADFFLFFRLLTASCFHVLVCLHSQREEITDRGRTGLFSPFLRLSLSFLSLLLTDMQVVQRARLEFPDKCLCWGVSGEQPHHNSWVEWTGECLNSMLWGFPNPNSLQGPWQRHSYFDNCAKIYDS